MTTKQKTSFYILYENENFLFECTDCNHTWDCTDDFVDEDCPECDSSDVIAHNATEGLKCGICKDFLPDEVFDLVYAGKNRAVSSGDAHQYICVECYKKLEEQENYDE